MPRSRRLLTDVTGAVIVETAIVLPFLIVLLMGILTYGRWFMAAHSLQQAANDAARAAVAGIDDSDRAAIVDDSIKHSVLDSGTVQRELVTVTKQRSTSYYTVTVSYNVARSTLSITSLIPLPGTTLQRSSTVKLTSI